MIIRSQDKTMIVNLKNIANLHIAGKRIKVVYFQGDCADDIAEYSTEEKAIKVLDMITEEYGKHYYGQGGQMATADYYVPPFAFIPPKVFQMPQDSEVQYERI